MSATTAEPRARFFLTSIPNNERFRRRNAEVTDGRGGTVKFVAEPESDYLGRRGQVTAEVRCEHFPTPDGGSGRRIRVRVLNGIELVESTTFELEAKETAFFWAAEKVAHHAI